MLSWRIVSVVLLLVVASPSALAAPADRPLDRLGRLGQKHKRVLMFVTSQRAGPSRSSLDLFESALMALASDTVRTGGAAPLEGWHDAMAACLGYTALARHHLSQGDYPGARAVLAKIPLVWARLRSSNHVHRWEDTLTFYENTVQQARVRAKDPAALKRLMPSLRYRLDGVTSNMPQLSEERSALREQYLRTLAASVSELDRALRAGNGERIYRAALELDRPFRQLFEEFR